MMIKKQKTTKTEEVDGGVSNHMAFVCVEWSSCRYLWLGMLCFGATSSFLIV